MHPNVTTATLPKKYHDAVERWRDMYLPDYALLLENWEKYFPRDPKFCLCAYRQCGMCDVIEVGATGPRLVAYGLYYFFSSIFRVGAAVSVL